MGKILKNCFVKGMLAGLGLAVLLLGARIALAEDAAAQALQLADEPGAFLKMAVGLLFKFKPDLKIMVVQAGMWLGAISSMLTALSVFLQAAATALSKVFQWGGLLKAKEFVDKAHAWLLPKVQYLSMFNVQKK